MPGDRISAYQHQRDRTAAIQSEVAQIALGLFGRDGFDRVTVNDLATAADVSRSTFLRYFASKEEAVLGGFDDQGQHVADALWGRPADEHDWTALRCALDTPIAFYRQDPAGFLTMARLVQDTPALCA
ncbi:hypothetical protein GCM10023080_065880 [Streptomyces pseudoechinosporeus]